MSFNASSITLENGLRSIRDLANQEKSYFSQWAGVLSAPVGADAVLNMALNLNRVITMMDSAAGLPGMSAYAQTQLGSPTYDIAAQYGTMRTAMVAILTWINANLPANAASVANGALTYVQYPASATAPLLALIVAAAATIS